MKRFIYLCLFLLIPLLSEAQTSGYCTSKVTRSNVWIQKISVRNWSNDSGGNGGYFYEPASKLTLRADTANSVQLDIGGFPRVQDTSYWRIWIDLNRDKDFEDAGELILQTKALNKARALGSFQLQGLKLDTSAYFMRVTLSRGGFSPACGNSTVIEMEDYRIHINGEPKCAAPLTRNIKISNIKQNQVTLSVANFSAGAYFWNIAKEDGTFVKTLDRVKQDSAVATGLASNSTYKVRLGIECKPGEIKWSDFVPFETLKNNNSNTCEIIPLENLSATQIDLNQVELNIDGFNAEYIEWRYRKAGGNTWQYVATNANNLIRINNLLNETAYESQVRQYCANLNAWSDWSDPLLFNTLDCVLPPAKNVFIATVFYTFPTLDISFNVFDIHQYEHTFRYSYRLKGSSIWIDTLSFTTSWAEIQNLTPDSTYEIKIEVFCGSNSEVFLKTVTVPPACFKIEKNGIKVTNQTNTSVDVYVPGANTRTCQYRYRIKGGLAFTLRTTSGGNAYVTLNDLLPGTTYEISARIVCGIGVGQEDWSEFVEFQTKDCLIPLSGDLEVVKYFGTDSILFAVSYLANKFEAELEYFWKYKSQKDQNWTVRYQKGDNLFLLKDLIKGATYDVQVTIKCPNSSNDSLAFSTKFTAVKSECGIAPDTSLAIVKTVVNQNLDISFVLPFNYSFQMRFRIGNGIYEYTPVLPYNYSVSFGTLNVEYEVQFRVICPDGNTSPWSNTMKILRKKALVDAPNLDLTEKPRLDIKHDLRMSIAPNPSSGVVSVTLPVALSIEGEGDLEIINTAGQKVLQQKVNTDSDSQFKADLSAQTPGLYFVRLKVGQQVITEKMLLIKQ